MEWMRKREGTLLILYNSLQILRTDPTYCPCKRRYSSTDFERIRRSNPMALNYPNIPSPRHYAEIIDEWFLKQCRTYSKIYADVPDITCKIFCKILRLLIRVFTEFQEIRLYERTWHHFNLGDARLAWDFNLAPDPKHVHGLYARIRYMKSSDMKTFEEMFTTSFIEAYNSSCFRSSSTVAERILAHVVEETEFATALPDVTDPQLVARMEEMDEAIRAVKPRTTRAAAGYAPELLAQV
jgi:hypothetical protein